MIKNNLSIQLLIAIAIIVIIPVIIEEGIFVIAVANAASKKEYKQVRHSKQEKNNNIEENIKDKEKE